MIIGIKKSKQHSKLNLWYTNHEKTEGRNKTGPGLLKTIILSPNLTVFCSKENIQLSDHTGILHMALLPSHVPTFSVIGQLEFLL